MIERIIYCSLGLLLGAVAWGQTTSHLPTRAGSLDPARGVEVASLQLKLGEVDTARATLQGVLGAQPQHFPALQVLARVELQAKAYAAAERAAAAALLLSPDDVQARVILGTSLLRQGQRAQGRRILTSLSSDELAKWTDGLAPDEQTAQPGERLLQNGTNDLERQMVAIYSALAKGELTQANHLLVQVEQRWPQEQDVVAARAQYYQDTGDAGRAVRMLEGLRATHVARHPATFPYLLELASAHEASGQLSHAASLYRQLAAAPDVASAQRQAAAQQLQALSQQRMLDAGDKALAQGDVQQAEHLFSELASVSPEDPTVLVFQANVLQAQGRHVEASRIYSSLKAQVRPGKRFDTQLDYAGSLASARRTDEAIRAYNEIVENPTVYNQDERKEAQVALDDLRQRSTAAALVEGNYLRMEEGSIWRVAGQASSARLQNGLRLHLRSGRDEVHLSSSAFPEDLETSRWFTVLGVDAELTSRWSASVFGGRYEDGGMAHAVADYCLPSGFSSSLRLAWNDPARDTILLEALDGRQHSVAVNTVVPLGAKWAWDSTLSARKIEVSGQNIGSALDAETQLRWHPYGRDKDTYLGYALDLSDFSPEPGVFSAVEASYFTKTQSLLMPTAYDAAPDSVQRHSLQAHTSTQLTEWLTAGATVEVAYRNESRQVENAAMAELLWHASSLVDVNARAEYYTSGAGPNLGQDVFLGALGLKVAW